MKTKFKQGLLMVCMLWNAMVCYSMPISDITINGDAIRLYETALQAIEQQQYEAALTALRDARQYLPDDGMIEHPDKKQMTWVPYGRGMQQVVIYERFDYQPNARIAEIQQQLAHQHRIKFPPNLILRWIALKEPSEDNVLDGGETGTVMLLLENVGQSDAFDVKLHLACDACQGLTYQSQIDIGDLQIGETQSLSFALESQRDLEALERHLILVANERTGFDSNVLDIVLRTRPYRPPALVLEDVQIIDGNEDAKIFAQEVVRVKANVKNVGEGMAEAVRANIELGEHVFLGPGSTQNLAIGSLLPGAMQAISFSFFTNRRLQATRKIPIRVILSEQEGQFGTVENLNLHLSVPLSPPIDPTQSNGVSSPEPFKLGMHIPMGKIKRKHAVAVIIGNKNYETEGVPDVTYAHNDAETIKAYLLKAMGYQEANIIYLLDATAARFHETFGSETNPIGKLYKYVQASVSDVFIYYSGHGAPGLIDKDAYFVPVDVDPNYITTSGYSLQTFYKNIAHIPSRHMMVVLDTCFSGNSAAGFLLSNVSPAFIKIKDDFPAIKNAAIFTSASATQVSSWYTEKRHSLFTYFFLKGLSGFADKNGDNQIMASELGQYLSTEVPYHARRIARLEQTPKLHQDQDSLVFEHKFPHQLNQFAQQ